MGKTFRVRSLAWASVLRWTLNDNFHRFICSMSCAPLDWQYATLPSSTSDVVFCTVFVRSIRNQIIIKEIKNIRMYITMYIIIWGTNNRALELTAWIVVKVSKYYLSTTMLCAKNIGTNDKFCRKVALLRYTERLKFRFQSLNSASKQKPHWRLGTRLPSSW